MMFKNFITALYFVESVSESKEWYSKYLGSNPIEEDDKFASFRIGSCFLNFHLADEASPVSTGGCVAYWEVDDLDKMVLRAESLGGQLYRGPLKVEQSGRTICQVRDPFGNVFGLESRN